MVTLPAIDDYSMAERNALSAFSPVFSHYLHLLTKPTRNFSDEIRQDKHRHWLKCALASFNNSAPTEDICRYWTEQTDQIIRKVWMSLDLEKEDISLLAFGKLGSEELNLSSDIDLVIVRENHVDPQACHPTLKKFVSLLTENTVFGFAYRLDFDLRPGGVNTPLTANKKKFFSYFDEYLEAWNRLSFIRMRPLIGPDTLNSQLFEYCRRHSFPRRLDFSVINEIKHIRQKINYQWRKANEPLDIKLSPGGIRDVELFVQSLQVIYGGKDPKLQTSNMTVAIENLRERKALKESESEFLNRFYWDLRRIENLIHIENDNHTYLLKSGFLKRIPQLDWDEKEFFENFKICNEIVGDFFTEPEPAETQLKNLESEDIEERSRKAIEDIRGLKTHSLKKSEVERLKIDILNEFIAVSSKIAIDRDLAIQSFRDFVFSIKSKSSIFYLLKRHPALLENLAWLFSISPFVGQTLSRRPELIDSFSLGQVPIDLNDDLDVLLENIIDYKLLGQLFAIIQLIKEKNVEAYGRNLTEQADFIVSTLRAHLMSTLAVSELEILCLGKWSGNELGIQSDLDFVFLTSQKPSVSQMKLARRLISLLSTPTKAGKLYNIDLRLKPNESAGPLILEKSRFWDFLENKAEAWQKQAYLRSRILGNESSYFQKDFDLIRIDQKEKESLEKILARLLKKPLKNQIDVKNCEGGIIHTEFVIQKHCLLGDKPPASSSTKDILSTLEIDETEKDKILKNYFDLRRFEQIFQICNDTSSTKVAGQNFHLERLSKILGFEDAFKRLGELVSEQQELLKRLDLNH